MTARTLVSGLFGLALAAFLAGLALYVSRYWTWRFWDQEGLFGVKQLGRDGDLLRRNLGDVLNPLGLGQLNALDVVLWGLLIFLVLSLLQWLWGLAARDDH